MRLAHKRKVQFKLKKRVQPTLVVTSNAQQQVEKKPTKKVVEEVKENPVVTANSVTLTPKQQQVLDIVRGQSDGANTKSIGMEAGQDEAKAASWATGALKKLVDENLVQKVPVEGNKVIYKAV